MRFISPYVTSVMLALAGLSQAGIPTVALAQEVQQERMALVTVRFNKPKVHYTQQLYGALAKALAAKQSVVFDVVSYAPKTGDEDTDARWQEVASHNTRAVLKSMAEMGVPAERISVSGQAQPGLKYDETRIFVR